MVCRVTVAKTQQLLAARAVVAERFLDRVKGLLGRQELPDGEAMVFPRCRSIHTLGMRFPIDAVFVNRDWRVVSVRDRVNPGRVVWPVSGAWGVIELSGGTLQKAGVQVGDQLWVAPESASRG